MHHQKYGITRESGNARVDAFDRQSSREAGPFTPQPPVAELENPIAQLEQRIAEYAAQLMAARSALEQEVTKRIWAEKELTEANFRLHDKSVRDVLTGLYNRRYLEESLDREMSRATRSGQSIGVMMIDIDHFKRCNDTFGHAAGDAVLHAVGEHLLSLTRTEDILCRYGGEEFVLVMTNASARAVWERAEALRVGVQGLKIEHESRHIGPVTLSIGIALLPDHGESWRAVLPVADAALYQAKQSGRNRVVQQGRDAGLSPNAWHGRDAAASTAADPVRPMP